VLGGKTRIANMPRFSQTQEQSYAGGQHRGRPEGAHATQDATASGDVTSRGAMAASTLRSAKLNRMRALQHYLGHKNIQHTVRYTEMAPDRFKDFWKD
jgi:hypothetical protein